MPVEEMSSASVTETVVDGGDYINEITGGQPEPEAPARTPEKPQTQEPAAEQQTEPEVAGQETGAEPVDDWREQRIKELAAEQKLDSSDPVIRKLLMQIATVEKRNRDQAQHHEAKWEEIFADVDKVFAEAEPVAQPKREPERQPEQPRQVTNARTPFDLAREDFGHKLNWQSGEDAMKDWAEAWGDPGDPVNGIPARPADYRKLHQLQVAKLRRDYQQYIMPEITELLDGALNEFRQRELGALGEIVPQFKQTQAQRQADTALKTAQQRLKNLPNFKPIFDEMMTPDPQAPTITIKNKDGSTENVVNSPFNRIMRDFPELLDGLNHNLPPGELITQYGRLYTLAAKHYVRERDTGLTPKKAEGIMAQGAEAQRRTTEEQRVRHNLNKGATASSPGSTASDDYVSDLNQTGGVRSLSEYQREARRSRR